jgi:hypothetical protein
MTSVQLVPALIVPLIVWRVYRRVRRNVGRQLFHPRRLITSIAVFTVLTGVIAFVAIRFPVLEEGLGGGLLAGGLLAWLGIHLTRFEFSEAGRFYTPNTYIGISVTSLLVGRIVYRALALRGAMSGGEDPVPSMFHSPLTLVFFGITAGYYVVYCAGVLIRGRRLATSGLGTNPSPQ